MRVDVFTQVPHAFGWLTEQRPLATVLGSELELRLLNYRDTTPLRSGQVDDDPYGGGAGMVLRVDVVDAALEAAYGDRPPGPHRRADAAGAPARPGARRGARAGARARASLVALRGLRRAHRRAPRDRRGLDRPVRPVGRRAAGDGACSTRSRAACPARSPRAPASTRASRPSSTAGSSTRTTRARPPTAAGRCPDVLLSGDHARIDALAARAEPVPEPRVSGVDERETPLERDRAGVRRATQAAAGGRRDRLADDAGRDPARRAD